MLNYEGGKVGDSAEADFARFIIVGMFILFYSFAFIHITYWFISDFNDGYYSETYNNTTSPISYFNMTVVDKYIDKDLVCDDYYVICKDMSDNEISKVDDMQLYYNVEVGKSYNISVETIGIARVREVVGEV